MRQKFRRRYRTAKYIFYKETLIDYKEHFWTFLGAFIGIGLIGFMNSEYLTVNDNMFLIGSFGAKTLHPPGGATALIANIGSEKIHALGFTYLFSPVLSGVLILLLVAISCNNATAHRKYPHNKDWYKLWKRRYPGKRHCHISK